MYRVFPKTSIILSISLLDQFSFKWSHILTACVETTPNSGFNILTPCFTMFHGISIQEKKNNKILNIEF